MRVLVIGGTGFIGPYVVRQLIGQGHDVAVYHRGQTEAELPATVRHIRSPHAQFPVLEFPEDICSPPPHVVIHMTLMGEADAVAALQAFRGRIQRIVAISSGDVYLAYGRLTGLEPGPVETGLLTEDSPLRTVPYPYRKQASSPQDWVYFYEKILVERTVLSDPALPATVLRLPKVYGPGGNADLATVYQFRHHPQWRWTHGYVENVAAAIVLAAVHPAATGRVYNVGEQPTPTVIERLATMPPSNLVEDHTSPFNFQQDVAYDTTRIRQELEYREIVPYKEGLQRTFGAKLSPRGAT